MAIKLYMDVHIKRQITEGLRRRGVDVLTAQEDNSSTLSDKELLDRAKILGRVLVTEDVDLIKEADRRLKNNEFLLGLIYLPQSKISIGRCIEELELLAKILEPEDFYNQIIFLPLK
jgi:predicted nuclease of predicted toxin-antitoxin system